MRVAFYDLDGTLIRGNVVQRYAWMVRRHPRRSEAVWRYAKAALGVPLWLLLDACSRHWFNVVFFRQYKGLRIEWLDEVGRLHASEQLPNEEFRHARARVAMDKAAGFRTVLVTGGLAYSMTHAAAALGFDTCLANRLESADGVATGVVRPPLLAGEAKASAMSRYAEEHGFDLRQARAYSDSSSDTPMLECVGEPFATNPNARLRKVAHARGWPVLELDVSVEPAQSRSA